jgi:hypothetical protein
MVREGLVCGKERLANQKRDLAQREILHTAIVVSLLATEQKKPKHMLPSAVRAAGVRVTAGLVGAPIVRYEYIAGMARIPSTRYRRTPIQAVYNRSFNKWCGYPIALRE